MLFLIDVDEGTGQEEMENIVVKRTEHISFRLAGIEVEGVSVSVGFQG